MQCNQPQAHPDRCNCATSVEKELGVTYARPGSSTESKYPQLQSLLERIRSITFVMGSSPTSSIGTRFVGHDALFHLKVIVEQLVEAELLGAQVAANRDKPEAITERHPPVAVNNPEYARKIIQQVTSARGNPSLDHEIDRLGNRAATAIAHALYSLTTERNELSETLRRFNGCYTAQTVDPLVRELDVLLNGEDGAAPQAMLCDLVAQVKKQGLQVRQDPAQAEAAKAEADRAAYYARIESLQKDGVYADALRPFTALMHQQLVAHESKGGRDEWRQGPWMQLMLGIYASATKLQQAVSGSMGDLIGERAADVANGAMMIADLCCSLDTYEVNAIQFGEPRKVQTVDLDPQPAELFESYEEYDACTPKEPLKTLVEAERNISEKACKCIRYGKGNPNWPCELHPDAVAEAAELERAVSEVYGTAQVDYDPEGALNRIGEKFAGDFTKSFVEPAPIIPIHDHSGED